MLIFKLKIGINLLFRTFLDALRQGFVSHKSGKGGWGMWKDPGDEGHAGKGRWNTVCLAHLQNFSNL